MATDRILTKRRTSALKRLPRSETTRRRTRCTKWSCAPPAHQAAQEAAEQARHRTGTAQYLLLQQLGQLSVLRIRAAAGRLPQRNV